MSDAVGYHFQPRSRMEAAKRRQVLRLAREVSATIGTDFFHSIVRHLATHLNAQCVYLGQGAAAPLEGIRTLAVYRNGEEVEHFHQDLAGTASGWVLAHGAFSCGKDAMLLFPLDKLLESSQAQAFVGVRLADSAGQPIGILALIFNEPLKDVTLASSLLEAFLPRAAAELERQMADDAHREAEERYRAFIASNPDGMWRVEFEEPIPLSLGEDEQIERIFKFGYLAECNDAMAKLLGSPSGDHLVGARVGELVPRANPRAIDELRAAIRSRFLSTKVETSFPDETGNQVYRIRTQFGIVENDELLRLWVTTRDITDLRRFELSLAASEKRFRDVMENINLPAVMLDSNGAVTFCNDCFASLAKRTKEEVEGRIWLEGIIPAAEVGTWQGAFSSTGSGDWGSSHFEGVITPPEGPRHIIAWDIVRFRNRDNQPTGLAAIGRDITRQVALEAEVRQAQTLDSIGRFASGIAHDFNNLLTLILGHTEQLQLGVREADPAHWRLSAIENAANECTKLTAQLLAIGRKQRLQPDLINLNRVIYGAGSIIRGLIGEEIELIFDLATPLELVYADPSQILRALTNLVTNARDAMPNGGKLVISTSGVGVVEGDEHYPPGVTPGPYVCLAVSDTGVGLTEEVKAHIYEPFFTTKSPEKGTGLGLSIVYGIVTQSGGHLVVRSEPGQGATFEILLPVLARG